MLSEDYQSIKEDSVSRLNKHLEANFTNTINAKNWIKSGMGYCKGHQNGGCPFCGQGLSGAKELIELYNSYFDDGYNTFINRISTGLSDELSKIENVNYNRKPALLSALSIINRYKELIKSETFLSRLKEFEDLITLIDEDNIVADKNNVLKDLKVKTEEKKQSPYKKIDSVNSDNLSRALTKYYDLLTSLNKLVEEMTAEIKAFKKPYYDMRSIQEVINKLSKELSYLEYKKARIEQDSECKMYIASQKDIELINSELKLLDNQLQIDQSGYVKKYFEEINTLLKIFGSKNFLLEQDVDNKGYLPVYSIKVKYHGEDIPNDKLDTIFCESDRRALALSVFWAKFNLMTEEEKKKAIIVLDDPVTSFDDNRITKTINVITAALPSITQMIILTHYPYFIKRVEQLLYSFNETQQHLILQKDEKTSYIEKLNLKDFVATDFQKIFCKIHDYVNRKCCDSIKTDLRPFLEKLYLPVIFAKPIKEHNININENLESLIESLYKCGAIKDKAKNKLHEIRKTLNPESHSFTLSNDEDVRTFAEDMLGFLFSLSYSD